MSCGDERSETPLNIPEQGGGVGIHPCSRSQTRTYDMSNPEQALQKTTGDGAPARSESAVRQFSEKEIALLKRTICQDATDEELSMFIQNCKRYGLDPFTGQIHAVKRWDKNAGREVLNVQVGIDGFRLIADRTGKWQGTLGPYWCGQDADWTDVWLSGDFPAAAKVGVLRSDFSEPRWAIARWDAYVAMKKDGDPRFMWRQMPAHMLAKCAEALALRSAFPNDLSGLYTDAEMDQAGGSEKRTYDGPDPKEAEAEVLPNGDETVEKVHAWEAPTNTTYMLPAGKVGSLNALSEALEKETGADLAAKIEKTRSEWDWKGEADTALDALLCYHERRLADEEAQQTEKAAGEAGASTPYDGPQDALEANFDAAWAEGNEGLEPISEAQLNRLYAIAGENDWDEAALNRLVKDELGYESKKDVPYGDPYDEICAALEDERLRYHMSRDPDTQDMFEENADDEEANHPEFEDDSDLPF